MKFHKYCSHLILLTIIILFGSGSLFGQNYYFYNNPYYQSDLRLEAGISLGAVNGMTDVGGSKLGRANAGFMGDFTVKETNFFNGLYAVATWRDWLGVRLDVYKGILEAADSNLKGTTNKWAEGRYVRNLSFKTSLFEISAGIELHPLMMFNNEDKEPPRFSPYLVAGVAWLKFDPKAYLNGVWYELQPLRLEGEGFAEYPKHKTWKNSTFEFPYGLGFRYELTQNLNLRLELIRHTTLTDYLDGVSKPDWVNPALFYKYLTPANAAVATQLYNRSTIINPPRNTRPRGNPNDNDAFWNINIKLGFNLSSLINKGGGNRGPAGKVRCPTTVL